MKAKKWLGAAALLLLAVLMVAAYAVFREKPVEGSKQVTIEVMDDKGQSVVYEVHTDGEYLQQAMEEAEGLTFEYEEGPYGASVHTVNGLRADYVLDGAYWSFTINGEYCNYGIGQQPVEDADAVLIAHTPA